MNKLLKLDEMYEYYRNLDAFHSDLFDDELCLLLVKYEIIEEGNPDDEEYFTD